MRKILGLHYCLFEQFCAKSFSQVSCDRGFLGFRDGEFLHISQKKAKKKTENFEQLFKKPKTFCYEILKPCNLYIFFLCQKDIPGI